MTAEYLILSGVSRILRAYFLLFRPMRERFRVRGWRAFLYLALGLLMAWSLSLLLIQLLPDWPYTRLTTSCFGVAYTFLVCHALTTGAALPMLFAVLLQSCYGDNIKLVVQLLIDPLLHGPHADLVSDLCVLALTALTLPVMYQLVRKRVCPLMDSNAHNYFWRYLWVIPASSYVIFRLAVSPGYFPGAEVGASPWRFLLLLWPIATTLISFLILKFMLSLTERQALLEKIEGEKALLAVQEERIRAQQASVDQARTRRHDMRHNFLAIQGLLAGEDLGEADAYITHCIEWLESGRPASEGPPELP